jgi:hypothetical protein
VRIAAVTAVQHDVAPAPDDTGAGDGSAVREKSQPDVEGAPDNDDGKATGNPNN